MKEEDVQLADWDLMASGKVTAEKLKDTAEKMHNLLLNLTTGEANAVVRRC